MRDNLSRHFWEFTVLSEAGSLPSLELQWSLRLSSYTPPPTHTCVSQHKSWEEQRINEQLSWAIVTLFLFLKPLLYSLFSPCLLWPVSSFHLHHHSFTASSQLNFFCPLLSLFFWFPFLPPLLSSAARLCVFALSPARSLSLSDKERFILSGSADCYVKIWALGIGMLNHTNICIHRHTDIYIYIY